MGRHHTSTDTTVVELSIPGPRVSPESVPAPVAIPQPRGWRARRDARAEAAAARDRAARIVHAQRRMRQVELASRV